MTRRPAWWLASALAAVSGAAVAAQQPQRPVFRAGVDLIQVDVVVLDEAGRPVHGLTKSDFTLLDRGVPQPIATLAELVHDRPPDPIFPAGLPLDVASNQTARSDRLVMIVFDDLHFRSRTAEAKVLVRRVVNELGAGASIGLVTTSGTFGVEVTEDRARLLTAIDRFLDRYDPGIAKIGAISNAAAADTEVTIKNPGPADLASFFGGLNAFRTVQDVARMVGADDGRRKAFVWISGGVPFANLASTALSQKRPENMLFDPCMPGSEAGHYCNTMNAMFEKLQRSSVSVYSVILAARATAGHP